MLLSLWRVVLLELIFGNKMKKIEDYHHVGFIAATMSLKAQNNFSTQGWWEPAGKTLPLWLRTSSITFRL